MVKKGGGRGSGRGKGAGGQGKQAPRRAQTRTQTIKELSMARGASEAYYEKREQDATTRRIIRF